MTCVIVQAQLLPPSLEEILMRSCGISVIICSSCVDPQHLMFPRLRTLNLSQNYLKDIPPCMIPPSLVTIDVCNNFLAELPATLASRPGLWNLFINDNKVSSLPAWILELEGLRRFSYSGNQIVPSPEQKQLAANVQMSINLRELARQGDHLGNYHLQIRPSIFLSFDICSPQKPIESLWLRKILQSRRRRG